MVYLRAAGLGPALQCTAAHGEVTAAACRGMRVDCALAPMLQGRTNRHAHHVGYTARIAYQIMYG